MEEVDGFLPVLRLIITPGNSWVLSAHITSPKNIIEPEGFSFAELVLFS